MMRANRAKTSPPRVVDWYVDGVPADLATIEKLARMQLGAVRAGCRVRLVGVSPDLRMLLTLLGLDDDFTLFTDDSPHPSPSTAMTSRPRKEPP